MPRLPSSACLALHLCFVVQGRTALHYAVAYDHAVIAKMLVGEKGSMDIQVLSFQFPVASEGDVLCTLPCFSPGKLDAPTC